MSHHRSLYSLSHPSEDCDHTGDTTSIFKPDITVSTAKVNTLCAGEGYVGVCEFFSPVKMSRFCIFKSLSCFLVFELRYSYRGKAGRASMTNISQSVCRLASGAASMWPSRLTVRLAPCISFLCFSSRIWSNHSLALVPSLSPVGLEVRAPLCLTIQVWAETLCCVPVSACARLPRTHLSVNRPSEGHYPSAKARSRWLRYAAAGRTTTKPSEQCVLLNILVEKYIIGSSTSIIIWLAKSVSKRKQSHMFILYSVICEHPSLFFCAPWAFL